MHLQAKARTLEPQPGVYCHVPFCATTCDFCAFYQEKPKRGDIDRYLAAMEREFELAEWGGAKPATVFWGGGTPGLLPARDLERLGRALLRHLPEPPVEWTVELAPSTVKADKVRALRGLGVTRFSLGLQSFQPDLLERLGRQHSPAVGLKAYEVLRAEGCGNVNVDLIFGVPGQDLASWRADMEDAVRLAPEHISTYCLTFEEDTALFIKLSEGKVSRDIERDARLYEDTWAALEAAGFAQYEISNFARPGRECIHNVNTWRMGEWLGFGPSAASQWRGRRFANPPDLRRWLASVEAGVPERVDVVTLSPETLLADALVFGLRMTAGVDLDELEARFPSGMSVRNLPLWGRLAEEGLLERAGARVRLTLAGRLVADQVGVAVLEALEE